MMAHSTITKPVKRNKVVCIGLGFSGVCLGAQLKIKWDFEDMHFYDRNESHSGTWWNNHYPGAACDIPILIYSFSFAQGQPWSKILPGYDEIRAYMSGVMSKYDLERYTTFSTACEAAIWDGEKSLWSLHMRNVVTNEEFIHECSILFSAVGGLNEPQIPIIPGATTFQGESMHTSRWRNEVSLVDKDVVVLGGGSSANQLIPAITSKAKSVTQIIRSPNWNLYVFNVRLPPIVLSILNIPLLITILRCVAFFLLEIGWLCYLMNKVGRIGRKSFEIYGRYHVWMNAPKKYHEILIPVSLVGCKRRVCDTNGAYFKALHLDNVFLVKENILEIKPNGILTDKKFHSADVIVYATGFRTNEGFGQLQVKGENGVWLHEHWKTLGGPAAYNTLAVPGYPNFFMIYGPNFSTGHTSTIVSVENAVNGSLKLIAPLLNGQAIKVAVREKAYEEWTIAVQAASKTRVFSRTVCRNWYTSESNWNGMVFPWSQIYYWWRQNFIIWNDWVYTPATQAGA